MKTLKLMDDQCSIDKGFRKQGKHISRSGSIVWQLQRLENAKRGVAEGFWLCEGAYDEKIDVLATMGNLMDLGFKNKGPPLKRVRIPAIAGARCYGEIARYNW